jgi:hypothetical protein
VMSCDSCAGLRAGSIFSSSSSASLIKSDDLDGQDL